MISLCSGPGSLIQPFKDCKLTLKPVGLFPQGDHSSSKVEALSLLLPINHSVQYFCGPDFYMGLSED